MNQSIFFIFLDIGIHSGWTSEFKPNFGKQSLMTKIDFGEVTSFKLTPY